MSVVRFGITIFYVPFMLIGFIGLAVYLVDTQENYVWLFYLLLAAISISFVLERVAPYQKTWNQNHEDASRDIWHFLVNELSNAASVLALPVFVALVPFDGLWPHALPLWIQLVLAIFVADMGITLVHYLSHQYELLWRFHAVHHSVKRMYGFNGLMKHPIHQAVEVFGGTLPLVLMGVSTDVAALLAFSVAIQLLLQHTNVDVKIGPLRYILALSPLHRFHHIKRAVEGDVNFGLFTTIWDRMLGTAMFDANRQFTSEDLGIEKQPDYPQAYLLQLAQPFRSKISSRAAE